MAIQSSSRASRRPPVRTIHRLHPIAACLLAAFAGLASAEDATLPEVQVQGAPETATGPVTGYRATRSATFTKTDEPLREVPASVSVVPSQLMKDQAMQSLSDVFRYVPGVLTHQGEGNRDQIILRGNSTTADFYVNGVRDDAQIFRDLYNLERVEILKGPGGMIFGRGGAGGGRQSRDQAAGIRRRGGRTRSDCRRLGSAARHCRPGQAGR